MSQIEKADCIEEINTELSVYLGMLYHLVEILKGNDDFAEELSAYLRPYGIYFYIHHSLVGLEPPLPVFLFNVVGGLRDKSAKGYPVKKVNYLLVWYLQHFANHKAASAAAVENIACMLWRDQGTQPR